MPVIPALEFKVILSYMDNLRTLWHIWDPSVHHPHLTPKKSISDIEIICTHTTKMFFPFWAQATPVFLPYGWYPTELKLHTPQISCAFKIPTLCEQPLINSGSMDCVLLPPKSLPSSHCSSFISRSHYFLLISTWTSPSTWTMRHLEVSKS